uniref:Uncharacterized protein n=1 Tax=Tanacetum cinerariifolium TaxID=118510 RepID=A0A6L2JH12_TANCI|nr:hypothetical protein [Tanacetum cinerariifolium]
MYNLTNTSNLIIAYIQGEPYYEEYLAKVVKHQRYLASETGSDPDSPAPKTAKATKKSKSSAPKADLRPPVTKPSLSQQPKPKPAPAKSKGKKSVDESVAEGIPEKEPRFNNEEADVQRALEESLKSIYDAPQGSLPSVVIREPESGKYQPLPEKKSPDDQFIFQRRTSTPTRSSGHDDSSSLYDELGLTDSEVKSDKDVLGIDAGVPDEGQAGPNLGDQDEGQARPNPDEQDNGQAGPNPSDAAASQPLPSLVVHAGPNLEHMDVEVTDVSTQPHPEQMDKGFTATAYPKVHENLKLTVEEQVILEEPASSTGSLSSLQHLTKDLSFGNLFFNDKPLEADNEKTTAIIKAESMVSVTIQQDKSAIPPMTTSIVDLTLRPDSPNVHQPLQATDRNHNNNNNNSSITTPTTTKHHRFHVSKAVDEIVTDAVDWVIQAPEADMKEILHQRMWETNSYKTHEDHIMLYEALEKSMNRDHSEELLKDLAKARKKKKKRHDSPKTPPGSPLHQPPPPSPLADDDTAPDAKVHLSNDEDIRNAHIPNVNLRQTGGNHLRKTDLLHQNPSGLLCHLTCLSQRTTRRLLLRLPFYLFQRTRYSRRLYEMEECHKLLTNSVDDSIIRHNVSKPLPLGGQPGQVTIQSDFFFNKDLEYLRYGSKGSRPALLISKMKAAYYPDVGLEQIMPDQIWIEEECKYDIVVMYGISHWWFQRQRFYIDRHTSEGDRRAVRTHMWILSVVRIEVFSMYGYDYMKKISFVKRILTSTLLRNETSSICTQIDEALDYPVKEFKVNRMNPGLNTRFWTRKDVDRSKEFMFAIQKWLKTRRIFRNLESFVGGRVVVYSSLRSLKPKHSIESRAKRSSKIISLGHYSIMLAFSHNQESYALSMWYWQNIRVIREPNETMILGRPFLATIHARIDVFNIEISLGIREDMILFDMDGNAHHTKIPIEKVYMENSISSEESFNLLEIEKIVRCGLHVAQNNKFDDEGTSQEATMHNNPRSEGFEEEEQWESGIEKTDYVPPWVLEARGWNMRSFRLILICIWMAFGGNTYDLSSMEKKRTRLQLYTKIDEETVLQCVETASPFHVRRSWRNIHDIVKKKNGWLRDGEEHFIIGEGVVVSSSLLERSTKSCLGGIMVSLILLEGLEEEAYVDANNA